MPERAAGAVSTGRRSACEACQLRSRCIPDHLGEAVATAFSTIVRPLAPLARGAYLFREGAPMSSYYFLRAGSAKSVVAGDDGRESIMAFLLPTDVVGAASLDQTVYHDSVVTLERSAFCEVRASELAVLLRGDVNLQRSFFAKIAERIQTERHARLRLEHASADQRVADFLLELSMRMEALGRRGDSLNLSMSRYDISNYVGLAPETVSRVLSRLRTAGLITVQHKQVELLDPAALARVAGGPAPPAERSRQSS